MSGAKELAAMLRTIARSQKAHKTQRIRCLHEAAYIIEQQAAPVEAAEVAQAIRVLSDPSKLTESDMYFLGVIADAYCQATTERDEANARADAAEQKLAHVPDTYETEYDGQMIEMCTYCDEQDDKHRIDCVTLSAVERAVRVAKHKKKHPDMYYYGSVDCPVCKKHFEFNGSVFEHMLQKHGIRYEKDDNGLPFISDIQAALKRMEQSDE